MAERDRLRRLQVGKSGHDRVGVFFRPVQKRADQGGKSVFRLFQLITDPEAKIKRHLVVARTRRVQAPCGRSDQIRQPRLDIHVDVFQPAREFEGSGLDF